MRATPWVLAGMAFGLVIGGAGAFAVIGAKVVLEALL